MSNGYRGVTDPDRYKISKRSSHSKQGSIDRCRHSVDAWKLIQSLTPSENNSSYDSHFQDTLQNSSEDDLQSFRDDMSTTIMMYCYLDRMDYNSNKNVEGKSMPASSRDRPLASSASPSPEQIEAQILRQAADVAARAASRHRHANNLLENKDCKDIDVDDI